ncbi:MAG: formate dehydrogenase accessory sulfurtransferase FdhD [Verrucomicrobiota bacterium]
MSECPAQAGPPEERGNVVDVLLASGVDVDLKALSRHVFTSSSCGICGRATLDRVFQECPRIQSDFRLPASDLLALPDRLREAQKTFEKTGGLHASGLFDNQGKLIVLREDVGRHNALDKVIGHSLAGGNIPLDGVILLVSGRISFELMQKAVVAGIPIVAGISAPSSLAVDCAERAGQTLVGFLRGKTMNVYTHAGRLR